MPQDQSVAPKERINIVYKPATNMDAEVELPFKMVVLADLTGRKDDTQVEQRDVINIDKDNFNKVLKAQEIKIQFSVPDRLNPDAQPGDEIPVNIEIDNMKSFEPDAIAQQIPEIKSVLEIREALVALKGPLGNIRDFGRKLKEVLGNDAAREQLLRELNISNPE